MVFHPSGRDGAEGGHGGTLVPQGWQSGGSQADVVGGVGDVRHFQNLVQDADGTSDSLGGADSAAGRLDCVGRTTSRLRGGASYSSSARSSPREARLECRNYQSVEPLHTIGILVGQLSNHF